MALNSPTINAEYTFKSGFKFKGTGGQCVQRFTLAQLNEFENRIGIY